MYTVLVICDCFLIQTPLVVVKFPNYVCVFHNPKLQWKLLINAPCILLIINSISPKECNELTPVLLYWILCSGYFQNLKKTIPPPVVDVIVVWCCGGGKVSRLTWSCDQNSLLSVWPLLWNWCYIYDQNCLLFVSLPVQMGACKGLGKFRNK